MGLMDNFKLATCQLTTIS